MSKETAFIDSCTFDSDSFKMNIKIKKEFYETVQANDTIPNGFNATDSYLVASIPQSELKSEINQNLKQLELSYQILIGKDNLGSIIRIYPGYNVNFRCIFSLQTSTLSQTNVEIENLTLKFADSRSVYQNLNYEMEILTPQLKLGTRVKFQIKPIHPNFIYNRISHCYVTDGNTGIG